MNDPAQSSTASRQSRSLYHACLCARVADEYRGQEIVVLDLTGLTPIVDYFVVATGTSARQMKAISDEAERVLKAAGSRPYGVEGFESSTWILQDYGDVVLHIFLPETRAAYDLEHLWADAPQVDWQSVLAQHGTPTEQTGQTDEE